MGAERKGSKSGGGYVGGFLQLFDWNAKSRKKLFSSKSDLPEQSKQRKRCDWNLPMTQIHMVDGDEIVASSSIKGSSDYSCASSVTDDDVWGTKPPGVVARLMGLDSLPTNNSSEPYSTPFSDSQSLRDFRYPSGNVEWHHDQLMYSGNLCNKMVVPTGNAVEIKHQKRINRPIEKFQTEVLPPKSAKSIPITHHKLLSPIKSSKFIPSKDAARIMEAAARIIETGPQVTLKGTIANPGSSSAPLKVRDLKEKVEASQKSSRLSEACRRSGQSTHKSWNGLADTISTRFSSDPEESSAPKRNKGGSVSLALQAKANVQKRECSSLSGSRTAISHKEPNEVVSSQLFKSQPSTQRNAQKKFSALSNSGVLRPNNQKQNCLADVRKSSSKHAATNTQGRKGNGDSSSARHKSTNKTAGNCKVGSRRSGSDLTNGKKEGPYLNTQNLTHKKRCIKGDYQFEKNSTADKVLSDKSGSAIQSGSLMDMQIGCPEESKSNATDIVSFTFTTPMRRPTLGAGTFREVDGFGGSSKGKRMLLSPDSFSSSKSSSLGKRVLEGDALSNLLEQKLRELTHAVEASHTKARPAGTSASICPRPVPSTDAFTTSDILQSISGVDLMQTENPFSEFSSRISSTHLQGLLTRHKRRELEGEVDNYRSNDNPSKQLHDSQFPSPISVLEPSVFAESFSSSDVTMSNSTGVSGSKLCSSVQAQDMFGGSSLKSFHPFEADVELLDSASSTSAKMTSAKFVTTSVVNVGKSTQWELEYVNEILSNVELMFKNFAMGGARDIINPHLFDHLEGRKAVSLTHGAESKQKRKVLFDCVSECLNIRCSRYANGGCRAWAKGLSIVRRKERLAEEVYNEISCWSAMGNYMVDELVDKDMSGQYGRWLDFESEALELGLQIENRLLNSLIDEVVADILVL